MADELRLKASAADYQQRLGTLDSKISQLNAILGEYEQLKNASTQVFGDGDSNLETMKAAVDANIKAVQGQRDLLIQARDTLSKVSEEMGIETGNLGKLLEEGTKAAVNLFKVYKTISNLVG